MLIKKKSDITYILDSFETIADWDAAGGKYYLVFEDRKRGGQWTLMKYPGGRFSVHGRGPDYHDEAESFFGEQADAATFLWGNRAVYNAAVKKKLVQEAAVTAEA